MIYLVSNQQSLFDDYFDFRKISIEDSINLFTSVNLIQFDTETTGRNPQLDKLLCMQLGSKKLDCQIVVDLTTVDILKYKNLLESKMLILQNAKFDLQFLYNYGIVPRKIYDTMIVEQLLLLGFPYLTLTKEEYVKFKCTYPYHTMFKDGNEYFMLSYALDAIAWKRLGVVLDKSVRGEIIWRGLDSTVIKYAADDVVYLEDIMHSQISECKSKGCLVGAKLECDFVPAISYLEWCGIKLDIPRWKNKMANDQKNLDNARKSLDDFIIRQKNPAFKKYTYVNTQGDLFSGFDLTPKCTLNWSSSKQVIEIAKLLGFNTVMQDKKTGEDKDSVLEKHLNSQKGINDEFLKLYFSYQEYAKVVSSFGQGHLDDVLPETGRIYTNWKQLGAASGRMSCGSTQSNESLARHKHLKPKECSYPNLQQLPHDAETRACFIAEKGNVWISCDYSAEEARLAGDIYQDEAIIKMFMEGIDSHSMYAKVFFKEELKDVDVNDVKKLRPDLRQLAKGQIGPLHTVMYD